MPDHETLDVHCHADQTVTIEGVTVPSADAMPLLAALARRTPPPVLRFVREEGSGYESVGRIIYQAVRAGFPDHSFSQLGRKPRPTLRPATQEDVPFLVALRHHSMDAVLQAAGASVKLSVLKVNPELHLYERLGFVVIGETRDAYNMLFSVA